MKKRLIILVLFLILINTVFGTLTVTITDGTSRRIFRDMESGDVVEGYVSVRNDNDFDVTVYIDSSDNNVEFDETEIYLQSDEEGIFDYSIKFEDETKTYSISVTYLTEDETVEEKTFTLMASVVLVEEEIIEELIIVEEEIIEEPEDEYIPKKRKTEELNEVCEHYSQCRNQRWLRGCIKQDCNWCCYNECTVMECDYELESFVEKVGEKEFNKVIEDTDTYLVMNNSEKEVLVYYKFHEQNNKISDAVNLNKILLLFVLMFLVMDLILIVFFWIKEHKKCDEE